MVLIKIGGSVITDKDSVDAFLQENTYHLARTIKVLLSEGDRFVLVHGTGSFGKPPAIEFDYLSGYLAGDRADLVARVQAKLRDFHRRVMDVFIEAGVPVATLSTNSIIMCRSGEIVKFDMGELGEYLDLGMVPIMYGDIVPDLEMGFHVCTSDKIARELAKALEPDIVIFATDVDGVYGEEMPRTGCEPMKTISPLEYKRLDERPDTARDVSGAMYAKVAYALAAAEYCEHCWILNGNVPERLYGALRGKDVVGTRVLRDGR